MFEEKLIELVKQHPILYNKASRGYKNIKSKFEVWTKIGEELNETDQICIQRWKSLRDKYSREMKAKNLPSGSSSDLKPEWEYLGQMSFLNDYTKTRNSVTNYSESHDTPTEWDNLSTTTTDDCEEPRNIRKRKRTEPDSPDISESIKSTLTQINDFMRNENVPRPNSDDDAFIRIRCIYDGLEASSKREALSHMLQYLCELQIRDIRDAGFM